MSTPSTLSPDDYARQAAAAFEAELRRRAADYGVPATDPAEAGSRAASSALAGQVWADQLGRFYDTAGARAALGGVSKQAVSERVRQRRLLGLSLASSDPRATRMVYPAWQFRPDLLRLLPAVLDAAGYDPARPTTGWTIASWLTTYDDRLGATPLEALPTGEHDTVCEIAADVRASLGVDERAAHDPAA